METQEEAGCGQVGRDPCLVHLLAAVGVSLVPTELTTLIFATSVHASRPSCPVPQARVCFRRVLRGVGVEMWANVARKFGPALCLGVNCAEVRCS